MINVIASITVKPGAGPELEQLIQDAREAVIANPVCLRYDLQRQRRNKDEYVMLETWESTGALKEHGSSEAFGLFARALGDLVAAAPTVSVFEPVGGQVGLQPAD